MKDFKPLPKSYKTSCRKAKHKVRGKLDYVCANCGKDVTMEIIYFLDAINAHLK